MRPIIAVFFCLFGLQVLLNWGIKVILFVTKGLKGLRSWCHFLSRRLWQMLLGLSHTARGTPSRSSRFNLFPWFWSWMIIKMVWRTFANFRDNLESLARTHAHTRTPTHTHTHTNAHPNKHTSTPKHIVSKHFHKCTHMQTRTHTHTADFFQVDSRITQPIVKTSLSEGKFIFRDVEI